MGLLVEGIWRDDWYDTKSTEGEFVRNESQFRNWVTADGSPGPTGVGGFVAASGRYHLYVSLACPWAHRTLIFRQIKNLQKLISVTVVDPLMLENGWELGKTALDSSPVKGIKYLYELYLRADPAYSGRVSVPVLWDKERLTIVNNESAEIIRMFNSAFNAFTDDKTDYYPVELRKQINAINERVYQDVNNGVYKAGFATTQEAYEKAFDRLFATLDWVEALLSKQRYLLGEMLTEADWRLFTTLIRFDAVYVGHFKTNLKRIEDFPNLSNYLRDLYQTSGVAETVNFTQIKTHYFASHTEINPTRIIPKGPEVAYQWPHDRGRFTQNIDLRAKGEKQ
jgi:glutathionyl-hydroquinone reductase